MVKKIVMCVLVCMGMISCSGQKEKLYRDTFVSAGTIIKVVSVDPRAAELVHTEFARLSRILNGYDETSQLYLLNHSHNQPIKVSPELIELIKLAKAVHRLTGGYFDISKGKLYQFWKQKIEDGRITEYPSQEEIQKMKARGKMDDIVADEAQGTVLLRSQDLDIDVGAIAKGYMVDKAIQKLKQHDVESAIISAGGDIYCLGGNRRQGWKVGIKDPLKKEKILMPLVLQNQAVATSGHYEQFFMYNDKKYSHLINPLTGEPVRNGIVSVSVVASNATTADSLATAFSVMGFDKMQEFLAKQRSTLEIYTVVETQKGLQVYVFE